MSRLSWRRWLRKLHNKRKSLDDAAPVARPLKGGDRRQLLQGLSAMVGGALASISPAQAKDTGELPPPKRALIGRNEAGKSVFKSFDVTSKVVEIDANPGLTFHELYMTEGVPKLTGLEPDPMLASTKDFPGPGGTLFRLISYPPKRPEGWKRPPGVTMESSELPFCLDYPFWLYCRKYSPRPAADGIGLWSEAATLCRATYSWPIRHHVPRARTQVPAAPE